MDPRGQPPRHPLEPATTGPCGCSTAAVRLTDMRNTGFLPLLVLVPALLTGCRGALAVVPMLVPHAGTVIAMTAIAAELAAQNDVPVAPLVVEEPPGDFEQVDLNEPAFKPTNVSDLPTFSQGTARAALDVDVSGCRERGLPSGYGSAAITFEPTGGVSRVTLHQTMSEDAQLCMRDAFDVTMPAFRGTAVDVPTRYYAK